MSDEFKEMDGENQQPTAEIPGRDLNKSNSQGWLEMLANLGLGETAARIGTGVLTLLLVFVVVWMMRPVFQASPLVAAAAVGTPVPTDQPVVNLASLPQFKAETLGVARSALLHTNIPDRPRNEIVKYTIAKGDTVIGIAAKFNLQPKTIMFGNYYTLRDDPENISVGQVLNILPVDGYYYQWQAGDGLNGVAKGLNVKPEAIINYPLNHLDMATIGNLSNPNIKPGTWLIVPGGTRPYTSWTAPVGITRSNPASAQVMGEGACGVVKDGAVGTGTFVWPANKHYLSGYDYTPSTNHLGIDIAGNTGEPIYAVDAGVVVYQGWSSWGYGNMVLIDHGDGWQSLYAHMNSFNVTCGQSVDQGWVIGTIGSTGHSSGSHLHFELMHTLYSKVNPWNYLPPP